MHGSQNGGSQKRPYRIEVHHEPNRWLGRGHLGFLGVLICVEKSCSGLCFKDLGCLPPKCQRGCVSVGFCQLVGHGV